MAALQLALGGSNPAVVCEDADVGNAAAALAAGMTKLNGQWCEAPRRVLVDSRRHDDLLDFLRHSLDDLEASDSIARFRRADSAFHLAVAAASGNPLLAASIADARE